MIKKVLLVAVLSISGCEMKTHTDFGFKELKISTECGDIFVAWRGKMITTKDGSISSSPYELVLWMAHTSDTLVSLNIDKLKLYESTSTGIAAKESDLTAHFKNTKSQGRKASILISDVAMEHSPHLLNLSYDVEGQDYSCKGMVQRVEVQPTLTKEEVSVVDMFMGI